MEIFGIGLEIIEINDFEIMLEQKTKEWYQKIFTERELEYCKKNNTRSLAVRYASKIAWGKACGVSVKDRLGEIEVVNDAFGKPSLHLYGQARAFSEAYKLEKSAISLSHSKTLAASLVILETQTKENKIV